MTAKWMLLGVVLASSSLAQGLDHFYELYDEDDGLLKILSPPGAGYDSVNGDLYTTIGSPVTVTAANPRQYCPHDDGTLTLPAANKPCMVNRTSIKVRSAVTNLFTYSEQPDHANWIKGGSVTPVITTNTHAAPDGTVTADTVTFEGNFPTVTQTFVANGGAYTVSAWMRTVSGTNTWASVEIRDSTAAVNLCIGRPPSNTLTTTWTRVTCTTAATTSGNNIQPGFFRGDGSSIPAGQQVVIWGGVFVTGTQPGDYCPTTGTSATCSGETATVPKPADISLTEGCFRFCLTPSWTGAPAAGAQYFFLTGGNGALANLAYIDTTTETIKFYDGTSTATRATTYTAGVRRCYRGRYSASQNVKGIADLTTGLETTTAFTSLGGFGANLTIGTYSNGTLQANAALDSIFFGKSANGCQ